MTEARTEAPVQRRVIVGVKESPASLAAIRLAVAEARRDDAVLYAVHVVRTRLAFGVGELTPAPSPAPGEGERHVRAAFEHALGGLPAQVQLRVVAVGGAPGRRLVELANRDDDLLVVGDSRRPGAWWSVLWPSVGRYCARRAQCRVLRTPPA